MLTDIAAFFEPLEAGVEDEAGVLAVDVPLVVVPVVVGVVAVGVVVPATALVEGAAEVLGGPDAVEFKQVVEPPVWTVNGADCEICPVLSRRVMSKLVPTAKLTAVQVNEFPA